MIDINQKDINKKENYIFITIETFAKLKGISKKTFYRKRKTTFKNLKIIKIKKDRKSYIILKRGKNIEIDQNNNLILY